MISVIIPLYNRENTISRSIRSVLAQTYKDLEVIVVDDGSTDRSIEVVRMINDGRLRVIELYENHGAAYARNVGMRESKGEYIAFQDSDDEWKPDKLKIQLNYIIENNVEIVFSRYIQHDMYGEKNVIPSELVVGNNPSPECIKNTLKYTNIIGTPTILMTRKVYECVGEFDTVIPKLEDYEYVIRIVKSFNIGFIDMVLMDAYIQENSLTNKRRDSEALFRIFEKHSEFIDARRFIESILFSGGLDDGIKMNEERLMLMEEKGGEFSKACIIELLFEDYLNSKRMRRARYKAFLNRIIDGEFAIFGVGQIGKKVYRDLNFKGIKPAFFIVSKKENDVFDGIMIKEIGDIEYKKIDVIVAVGRRFKLEVSELLMENGFSSYVIYEE